MKTIILPVMKPSQLLTLTSYWEKQEWEVLEADDEDFYQSYKNQEIKALNAR